MENESAGKMMGEWREFDNFHYATPPDNMIGTNGKHPATVSMRDATESAVGKPGVGIDKPEKLAAISAPCWQAHVLPPDPAGSGREARTRARCAWATAEHRHGFCCAAIRRLTFWPQRTTIGIPPPGLTDPPTK